jgi:hypothetical protein
MQAARKLLEDQRAATLEQAFRLLSEADGVAEAIQPLAPNPQDILVHEVQTLRQQLAMQQAMIEELHAKLDNITKALEPGKEAEAGSSNSETLAELEEQRRLNTYLKGEIVRRDAEAEKVKRPWWKWWAPRARER